MLERCAIDTAARVFPQLKPSILKFGSLTPLDLETTYGLTEGDLNHGQLIMDQMFFMRPLPGWSNHKTPIDGLYLCGSGVHGGGGISGASGRNAAREVIKADLRRARGMTASGFRIGDVEIPGRVLTAPMTGVSDLPFRRAASRLGAAYVATEMVACETFVNGRPDVVRRAAVGDGLPLTVIQLVGREARFIAKATEIAEAAGADIIDLNMGCPCKEVTGGLSGSALMRDLDHAERLIDAAVGATSRPVTLKMRLGWDRRDEERAGACGKRRTRGRQGDHRPWPHAPAVLQGRRRLARRARRQERDVGFPIIVNGDIVDASLRARGAGAIGSGRRDDRPRRLWAAVDRGGDRPGARGQ